MRWYWKETSEIKMNLNINRNLFAQVNVDSGSLSMRSAIVHPFIQPGQYEATVFHEPLSRRFTILVSEATAMQSKDKPSRPSQVNIDLKDSKTDTYALNAGGYAVFHTSSGAGYYFEVSRLEKEAKVAKVFDSRELKDGDRFSALIIRPGTYTVTNTLNNSMAELVVNYPELGKARRNLPSVTVDCSNEIGPNKIQIDPLQGLVFTCRVSSRIKIDLIRPEDRQSRVYRDRLHKRRDGNERKILRSYRLMPSNDGI